MVNNLAQGKSIHQPGERDYEQQWKDEEKKIQQTNAKSQRSIKAPKRQPAARKAKGASGTVIVDYRAKRTADIDLV